MGRIKESFAVLGLSRFGYRTAVGLHEGGASVIAIDRDDHVVQRVAPHVTKAVQADVMHFDVMAHLGVFDVGTVVIGLRKTFEASVLLVHHLRANTKVERVIAQVDAEAKGEALRLLGATETVLPESDSASRLVRRLVLPNLIDRIPLSPTTSIVEMELPEGFLGKSIDELRIRTRFSVYVIGVKRHPVTAATAEVAAEVIVAPPPDLRFAAGDTMLVLGETRSLEKFAATARKARPR